MQNMPKAILPAPRSVKSNVLSLSFYHPDEYNKVVMLRRALTGVPPVEAMELLLGKLKKTQSNIMFLLGMATG